MDPNLTIRLPSGIPPPHRTAPNLTQYRRSDWPSSASPLLRGIAQQYHGLGSLYLAPTDSHPTICLQFAPFANIANRGANSVVHPYTQSQGTQVALCPPGVPILCLPLPQ